MILTDEEIFEFRESNHIAITLDDFRAIEAAIMAKFEAVAYLYFDEAGNECFGHPDGYYPENAAPLYALKEKP